MDLSAVNAAQEDRFAAEAMQEGVSAKDAIQENVPAKNAMPENVAAAKAMPEDVPRMEVLADDVINRPFIFAISGYKNSGKTTLICQLIPELKRRGYRVAVIKHDGHDFVGDVPGTDSFRHRKAGAWGCAVFSKRRILITREIESADEKVDEKELTKAFPKADIILLEGLKNSSYPKYFCYYPKKPLPSAKELADRIEGEMRRTGWRARWRGQDRDRDEEDRKEGKTR